MHKTTRINIKIKFKRKNSISVIFFYCHHHYSRICAYVYSTILYAHTWELKLASKQTNTIRTERVHYTVLDTVISERTLLFLRIHLLRRIPEHDRKYAQSVMIRHCIYLCTYYTYTRTHNIKPAKIFFFCKAKFFYSHSRVCVGVFIRINKEETLIYAASQCP